MKRTFDGLLAIDKILKIFKIIFAGNTFGVTYNEFLVFITISNNSCELKDISSQLLMDKGQTSKILKSLKSKKLIERCNQNRPSYLISEEGKKLLGEIMDLRDYMLKRDFEEVSSATYGEAKKLVIKLEEILTGIYIEEL